MSSMKTLSKSICEAIEQGIAARKQNKKDTLKHRYDPRLQVALSELAGHIQEAIRQTKTVVLMKLEDCDIELKLADPNGIDPMKNLKGVGKEMFRICRKLDLMPCLGASSDNTFYIISKIHHKGL
ncbi:MAG: hypothetical protein IPG59_13430 [Candidatus Melainabacteria bacterium]|nr:MAG: hypothetical protein IPG59_13430 [Candidatus Melainabacteria bacterium]